MPQRRDVELRQSRGRVAERARREHQCDPLSQQAASHEGEGARRCTIEPLRVIDDAEERLLLGGLRQQAKDRQPHEEGIRRRACAESEGDGERVALGLREALHELEEGRAQVLKRRERQLHLALDADGAGDAERRARLDRVLQQGRLADARLSVQHEDAAAAVARGPQKPVEHFALAVASHQVLSRHAKRRRLCAHAPKHA
ncbi:MAG TPA: hypothetical protein VK501_26450 [Baekduia sp.]|nr:hypothetical protein [Baekduia sp.]